MILVYGVGINDSKTKIRTIIKGKSVLCPYYTKWCGMLRRCYMNGGYDSYKDCSVSDEWLVFTNFRKWMKSKDWRGKHLDKDIMSPDNKVYCAEHCIFVDNKINRLMSKSSSKHSGITIDNRHEKTIYRVEAWFCKKRVTIGSFSSEIKAKLAYNQAKVIIFYQIKSLCRCSRAKIGIQRHIEKRLSEMY